MKRKLLAIALLAATAVNAQRDSSAPRSAFGGFPGAGGAATARATPRPYKEVITDKAITKKGLFTVHKVDDRYYFEIADTTMGREILAVTRFSRVAGGGGKYGGEEVNEQSLKFERGPSNNVFIRVVTLISTADSTTSISRAVKNSYLDPIAAAFPIAAFGKDSGSVVIEVTDFFKGDNQIVSLDPNDKRQFGLGALAADRSYIQSINTYPINTEIRTVKTYSTTPSGFGGAGGGAPTPSLPAAQAAGVVTVELNTSMIMLPRNPMARRMFDSRVGYFADRFVVYSDDQQKVENQTFAVRWRLEPKPEDMQKYLRGELVEPAKQIIYYIDPATPKQWVKPLIDGINDWQKAFEKAGFKNAIVGKEWPNDPNMSLEDARYSVIRYFASDIENAYGPQVHDPRSGEILESHIGWYHNVMKLVHDWYMIQTAAVDPRARSMKFDDELMGQLIRFVSSHEVGHTLGLRHNHGSSSKTPVEKMRDKAWVEANGHTASIMDYARFNYVAQPEDNISEIGLFPRIGDYDKWAIEWGYRYTGEPNVEKDKLITNKWTVERLAANPRLWFGGEGGSNQDPRTQTEDLGDDNVKASEYGIKNLKRIMPMLPEWTKEEADHYENLSDIYGQLLGQYNRYMGHVAKNVGGYYETFKSEEDKGDVYEAVPKAKQREAVAFLNRQLFETPTWLLDKNIFNKIGSPLLTERPVAAQGTNPTVQTIQTNVLNSLLDPQRMYRLVAETNRFGASAYGLDEMMDDLRKGVWSELSTRKPIDTYRRNLQKAYAERLISIVNPAPAAAISINAPRGFNLSNFLPVDVKNTDVTSVARGQLRALQAEINAAIPGTTDRMSKYHLQDVSDRIRKALDPKG
jgi:hypothetical protein